MRMQGTKQKVVNDAAVEETAVDDAAKTQKTIKLLNEALESPGAAAELLALFVRAGFDTAHIDARQARQS